ncbi:hypothetical protein BKA56DRAFT_435969, partial [Ilyonectria sp. MPI-CAGE-AT-0026]
EMRDRTFKAATIISAWAKCGIYPFNPSVVLDRMNDPLSSLGQETTERELPGYVTVGDTSESETDVTGQEHERGRDEDEIEPENMSDDENEEEISATPKSSDVVNWNAVNTPPPPLFNLRVIQNCQEYVALRIEASISRKAAETLMLNGITATEEMRRLKEKNLRRTALQKRTSVVCNYGPIRVHDARIRIAKDDYNRQAAKADEERRVQRKETVDEVKYIRRWLRTVRSLLRASLNALRRVDV